MSKEMTILETKTIWDSFGDYDKGQIKAAEKFNDEISAYYPCETLINVEDGHGYSKVSYSSTFLVHRLKIQVRYNAQHKRYNFMLHHREMKNITYRDEANAKKELVEPNSIGKLTTKKIEQWVAYYEALHLLLTAENEANLNVVDGFMKKLESLPVQWRGNNKQKGFLKIKDLEMEIDISENHYATRIKYVGENNLASFLKHTK